MRALAVVALALVAAGCATVPPAPDPSIDLSGRWTIVAVDGERTGGGRRFSLELNPSYGAAQFGCNTGSGSYTVRDGWFVAGDWIITAAGCPNRESWLHFEREGFEILAKPLAIERTPAGVRLRNERGSILLDRQALPHLPGTKWLATAIGPEQDIPPHRLVVSFTEREWQATAGCNWGRAIYTIAANQLRLGAASTTERGCGDDLMAFEDRAFRILSGAALTASGSGDELIVSGLRGPMILRRLP